VLRKPIINTVVQILGKGMMVAIGLISTGILTRSLGSVVFGWFTLTTSVFILLDALADFGTRIIGVREISQVGGVAGRQKFKEVFVLRILMASLATMIGLVVVWGWEGFGEIRWEATLLLLMIILTSVAGSLEILFQVEMRMEKKVLVDLLFPLLSLIWLVWWREKIELGLVFGGYVVARFLSLWVGVGLVGGWRLKVEGLNIDWLGLFKLFKESWPVGLYLIIFTAYDRAVDSLMIERLLGVREVAWYGLAYKIYLNLLQPAYFWVSSVFPLLAGGNKKKKRLFWASLAILTVVVGMIIGVISIGAPVIVEIIGGESFGASAGVLRILVWACLFSYIGHLLGFSLISRQGQREMLGSGVLALIFNILANWWMIPRFGMYGAAGVTVATEALGCGMMGWNLWRKVRAR